MKITPSILRTVSVLCVIGCAAVIAGCGSDDASSKKKDKPAKAKASKSVDKPAETKPEPKKASSGPTMQTVSVTDPVENAFTVNVPKGWDNQVYSSGDSGVYRNVVNSVSPDGKTILFVSDPKLPNYWSPESADNITRYLAERTPFMKIQSYVPAIEYYRTYTNDKFGKLPDFNLESVEPNDVITGKLQSSLSSAGGFAPTADAVDVRFSFTDDDGDKMHAALNGYTINGGPFWYADVQGLTTEGDVDDYGPMLGAIAKSVTTNPQWQQKMNDKHQLWMAQLQASADAITATHNANMAWIQNSADSHQSRMQAI